MRLLVWMEQYWPHLGGDELACRQLLPMLASRGHEVQVIASRRDELPEREVLDGVEVVRPGLREPLEARDLEGIAAATARLTAAWRAFRPDVAWVFLSGPASVVMLPHALRAHRPALALGPDAMLAAGAGAEASHKTIELADLVITRTEGTAGEVERLVPAVAGRTVAIPWPVMAGDVPPAPLPADPPVVGFLGRLIEQKGADVALRSFAAMRRPAEMVVRGRGPERDGLKALAAELGVASRVRFADWVPRDQVPAALNELSALVMPSRHEEQGVLASEASLMGRPVVASRVGGLAEVVSEVHGGPLVEPGDVEGFARALDALVGDPDGARRLGARARRLVSSRFGAESICDRLDAALTGLRRRAPAGAGA